MYTKHNVSADLATRATKDVVQNEMGRPGLREIDLQPKWNELLALYEAGAPLVMPGEEDRLAHCQPSPQRETRAGPPAATTAGRFLQDV